MTRHTLLPKENLVQFKVCIALKIKKTESSSPAQRLRLGRQQRRNQDRRDRFVKLQSTFSRFAQHHLDVARLTVGLQFAKQGMTLTVHIDLRQDLLSVPGSRRFDLDVPHSDSGNLPKQCFERLNRLDFHAFLHTPSSLPEKLTHMCSISLTLEWKVERIDALHREGEPSPERVSTASKHLQKPESKSTITCWEQSVAYLLGSMRLLTMDGLGVLDSAFILHSGSHPDPRICKRRPIKEDPRLNNQDLPTKTSSEEAEPRVHDIPARKAKKNRLWRHSAFMSNRGKQYSSVAIRMRQACERFSYCRSDYLQKERDIPFRKRR